MKIGILTQPLHANYGGLLQNYALQQTLIRAGHEVETIDWGEQKNIRSRLYRLKIKFYSNWLYKNHSEVRYLPSKKELAIIWQKTNYFIEKYINHSKPLHSYQDFKNQINREKYDAYVVGSDQCWRPSYNSFLSSMFLDFTEHQDVKRISYAASFGTDVWEFTPQQTEVCSKLAKYFDLVTVREDSGVKLCKDYLGVKAIHVLDPTMLLTKEDYISLIEAENEPKATGSLFCYVLDPNKEKASFINKIALATGLNPFQILPKYQAENRTRSDIKKRIEDCVYPRVTAWLRGFLEAEMTIVDSFHGMVFSIIFNKPFWVLGNKSRGNARFDSLLKIFGLQDRIIKSTEDVKIDEPINWTYVNNILAQKRKFSKELLLNQLK